MLTPLGLWGRNPLGYLASLGLTLIAPQSSLCFTSDEYAASSLSSDEIIASVMADASDSVLSLGAMVGEAERCVLSAVAAHHPDQEIVLGGGHENKRAERARRKRELAAWNAAMDAPTLGLDFTSGQGDILSAGRALASHLRAEDAAALVGREEEPPRPVVGAMLRLSHTDGVPCALRATRPSASAPRISVATSWLAWRAIVALPLLGSAYAGMPAILPSSRALVWQLWTSPSRWDALSRRAMQTKYSGMYYSSRIIHDRYGYGSLSPAACVVVAGIPNSMEALCSG